ncbi:MAG: hypothetical protein IKO27_00655 [Ruminococcus sp.]|nr:hypothetical protein [Ruminococcus sp.]
MRCSYCEIIPLTEIKSPMDYLAALEAFDRMESRGILEKVYENYSFREILTGMTGGKTKFFHQYRCRTCSTVYGMFVNTTIGGEIRINEKIFDPSEYEKKPEAPAEKEDKS